MKKLEFIKKFELKDSSLDKVCKLFNKLKIKYSGKYEKLHVDFRGNSCDDYVDLVYFELYGTREETEEEKKYRKEYYKKYGITIPF